MAVLKSDTTIGGIKVVDALTPYTVQATAPSDTSRLWVDTSDSGILKYYNGTAWVPVAVAWG